MSRYIDALHYLYSFTNYEQQHTYVYSAERFDLKRVHRLLEYLGNPHHRFPSVHIAGTKGKGSTCAMVEQILREAGYRTGFYSSPHLHTFRERIRVNGELIPEDDVAAGVERMRPYVTQIPDLTTFELITALAFTYFAEQAVDMAIVEVGMGGRLDATNVITPCVTAITPISLDHTQYLGPTLAAIAGEKAGIIKPGIPVVCAPQPPEALAVIRTTAEKRNAPFFPVETTWHATVDQISSDGSQFRVTTPDGRHLGPYHIPLLGAHQIDNALTALAIVDQLRTRGLTIPEEAIHTGLREVRWPARLELLNRAPWLLVDGAHNGDSAHKLATALQTLFPHRRTTLILGFSRDKQIETILDTLLPLADFVLLTQARHPRALQVEELATLVRPRHPNAEPASSMEEALERALQIASADDLICATGSLFIAAEARYTWFQRTGASLPPTDDNPITPLPVGGPNE